MINNSDSTGFLKQKKLKYMLRSAASTALSPVVSGNRTGTDVATTPRMLLSNAEQNLSKQSQQLEARKQQIDSLVKEINTLTSDLPITSV